MPPEITEEKKNITALYKVFLGFVIFFILFGWLAFFWAVTGLFSNIPLILSIIASAFLASCLSLKIKVKLKDGKIFILVVLISLAVSLAACYFATPTIFGGRDQGSISTAAISLAQNHRLKSSSPLSEDLFKKYGAGKALNFPGFDYAKDGKLLSRFPAGYTSYLATTYNFFGLKGIQYSNFPFLFLFLVSFWLILRETFPKWTSFSGFLLAATFFPFLWFTKYTLTETYMLFLAWSGIFFAISYLKEKKHAYLLLTLLSFGLSSFVRIEGIAFLVLAVGYFHLPGVKNTLPGLKWRKYLPFLSVLFIFLYVFLNFPTLFDSLKNVAKVFLPEFSKNSNPSGNLYLKLFVLFFSYNFIIYLIAGISALLFLLVKIKRDYAKTEYIPAIFLFPTIAYLFLPLISLDDPWMFRRYVFSVFPLLIFYSVYAFWNFFIHKRLFFLTLVLFAAINGLVSWRFLNLSESKELLPQVGEISKKFKADDLVLVDSLATGNGFALMSEPMRSIFSKQAVYFFNADDLGAIQTERYKRIFLIAPSPDESSWYFGLAKKSPIDIRAISNNYLESSQKLFELPKNIESKVEVGIWRLK